MQLRYIRAYLRTRDNAVQDVAPPKAENGNGTEPERGDATVGEAGTASEDRGDPVENGPESGTEPEPEPELDGGGSRREQAAEEEKLLEEVRVFTLASHLFWTLWSIVNAPVSTIAFGYWVRSPLSPCFIKQLE